MDDTRSLGWMAFAGIMLMVGGTFRIIAGITVLVKDELLLGQVLFANLAFWGWTWLVLGIVEVVAGFSVLARAQWARWFGIVIACLGMVWSFTGIFMYPLWSIVLLVLQGMVIYGLAEYGGDANP